MSEPTTISVRGEATRAVQPDVAIVHALGRARSKDKQDALDRAARLRSELLAPLEARGAQALTAESVDAPLTWAIPSFSAQPVRRRADPRRGTAAFEGWRVQFPVTIRSRRFDELEAITADVAALRPVRIHWVSWEIDPRNAAWAAVRAEAIRDAIDRARDYAGALGGELTALVHVADAGLLGADGGRGPRAFAAQAMGMRMQESGSAGSVSVDPQPLDVSAVIEARFTASIAALA